MTSVSEAEQSPGKAPGYRRFDVHVDPEGALRAAAEAIAAGECIVLPTDTVYGIGADAMESEAVQKLLDAKERGRDMPPPVLISDAGLLDSLVNSVNSHGRRLAERFWPGPLTLILKAQPRLRMDLGDTAGTIAVRVPDHDFTRDVLRRTGPLAVSSANVSGKPAAITVEEAIEQLGDRVRVYLDAGPTPGPEPSTIVDFVAESLGVVVRSGVLSLETLRGVSPFIKEPERPANDEPVLTGEDPTGPAAEGPSVPPDPETGGEAPPVEAHPGSGG